MRKLVVFVVTVIILSQIVYAKQNVFIVNDKNKFIIEITPNNYPKYVKFPYIDKNLNLIILNKDKTTWTPDDYVNINKRFRYGINVIVIHRDFQDVSPYNSQYERFALIVYFNSKKVSIVFDEAQNNDYGILYWFNGSKHHIKYYSVDSNFHTTTFILPELYSYRDGVLYHKGYTAFADIKQFILQHKNEPYKIKLKTWSHSVTGIKKIIIKPRTNIVSIL